MLFEPMLTTVLYLIHIFIELGLHRLLKIETSVG